MTNRYNSDEWGCAFAANHLSYGKHVNLLKGIVLFILGLNKTTLLDYPGCVAATIFTGGCNFCCPFCHNKGLVVTPAKESAISEKDILDFLRKRKNILKGVCITGGEPTLQADLADFIVQVKEMGYRVKLDTNGYQPEILKRLLEKRLLNYVAMDVKNCPDHYALTAGRNSDARFDLEKIEESVQILLNGNVAYEFRTTVVKELHTIEDMVRIGEWIKGCDAYYLQKFQDNGNNIVDGYHAPEDAVLKEMVQAVSQIPGMNGKVYLRGFE